MLLLLSSFSSSSSSSSSGIRSMAETCFSSPHIPVHKRPIIKPARKTMMLLQSRNHSNVPLKKAPTLVARSSSINKVFENQSEGILCYIDDNGEIICEGYDEGPRFHRQLPRTSFHPRDAEIINLLQQRLLQIVNDSEFNNAGNGVIAVQDDLNRNGFNKFC